MNSQGMMKSESGVGTMVPAVQRLIRRQLPNLAGLRGSLLSAATGRPVRNFLVTGGLPGTGATTVAIMIATALAASDEGPVVLVDANVQRPHLYELFGLPAGPGLAELSRGTAKLDDCLVPTETPNLSLMRAGRSEAHDPQFLLGGPTIASLIESLEARRAWVVIDAPPMLNRPEAMMLVPHSDGVVLTVACETTKKDVPVRVRERVENAGGSLLGVVLNHRQAYLPKTVYRRV